MGPPGSGAVALQRRRQFLEGKPARFSSEFHRLSTTRRVWKPNVGSKEVVITVALAHGIDPLFRWRTPFLEERSAQESTLSGIWYIGFPSI